MEWDHAQWFISSSFTLKIISYTLLCLCPFFPYSKNNFALNQMFYNHDLSRSCSAWLQACTSFYMDFLKRWWIKWTGNCCSLSLWYFKKKKVCSNFLSMNLKWVTADNSVVHAGRKCAFVYRLYKDASLIKTGTRNVTLANSTMNILMHLELRWKVMNRRWNSNDLFRDLKHSWGLGLVSLGISLTQDFLATIWDGLAPSSATGPEILIIPCLEMHVTWFCSCVPLNPATWIF